MLCWGILSIHLLLHMIDLQRQDTQTIDSPRRTLRIQLGISLRLHVTVSLTEIGIDFLHQICTVLIASVDSPFQGQRLNGIDMWVADDILIMPLNGVDPTFQIQVELDAVPLIRIMNGGVYIICQMIVLNHLIEDFISVLCKWHCQKMICLICKATESFWINQRISDIFIHFLHF